jgi:ankyrin repeat protein
MSIPDNLRKSAKRWLKALRANESEARARLRRAHPAAPDDPGLRDVQHALARERGHASWTALLAGVKPGSDRGQTPDDETLTRAELVAAFLGFACWDHHVHGKGEHAMQDRGAQRLLAQHPELARDSLYPAVVCGDLNELERILAERPAAATEPGGPRGWTPLLYLCYARFSHQPTIDNAVAIARALLDRGANPNDFYMAGDAKYTALVGVAGEGEQDSPRQPRAEALFQLLLERGAEPFDIQVLYNTHFSGDMLWWLELIHAHTLKMGRTAEWSDPGWSMLDMGGYGPGAYFILKTAIAKNDRRLAEWALSRGAAPEGHVSTHPKFRPTRTLYEDAVRAGLTAMADLLVRYGATPRVPVVDKEERFIAACFRLDRDEVLAALETHPEYLQSPAAIFAAAREDRAEVVSFLLDLGVPIEIEGSHRQRALHEAAGHNALRVAQLLIDRGAEIDPRESNWDATPIGFAAYANHVEMVDFLSRYSRNVWTLTYRGYVDRLREVLHEEPGLAKVVTKKGVTPLWWLPDDEGKALEIADLFLALGADPSVTVEGETAASRARKRGLIQVARKLAVHGAAKPATSPPPPDLATYERLAQSLLFAFETGQADAMGHLREHYGGTVTWDELRAMVRQRLGAAPERDRPDGYFALPHARLLVAREAGFDNWTDLVRALQEGTTGSTPLAQPWPEPDMTAPGTIQPVEMRTPFPVKLWDGVMSTTTDVWQMLTACRDGDLERVKALVASCPSLVRCDYNYMPPIHLAVREGHVEVVRYLAGLGAVNPKHVTYPYNETLATVALDRGYEEIARILEEHLRDPDPARPGEESGEIDYGTDEERRRFERLVGAGSLAAAEKLVTKRPELATDPFAFWSEGILSMPANRGNRAMIELLLRHGARVPCVTKWGRAYYFKHYDIAEVLMANGMDANHMNCHRTTLLHDMAHAGDVTKAQLLLDRGAGIDAIDEEFQSTPLGLAARWGHREMVAFLLARGANPTLSGAPWATPLEWARKKGHAAIEAALRKAV